MRCSSQTLMNHIIEIHDLSFACGRTWRAEALCPKPSRTKLAASGTGYCRGGNSGVGAGPTCLPVESKLKFHFVSSFCPSLEVAEMMTL